MEAFNKQRFYTIVLYLVQHREGYSGNEASSSNSNFQNAGNNEEPNHLHNEYSYHQKDQMVDHDRVHDMITDPFSETTTTIADETGNIEELNLGAKMFYKMLDAAN